MTEYRGSAILICSPLPALRTKNSFEIIRSTTHSVDESYKLGVYEFTQHLVIENYCNGMNFSFYRDGSEKLQEGLANLKINNSQKCFQAIFPATSFIFCIFSSVTTHVSIDKGI